ncbi:MAG: hypothetical protein EPO58_17545 [Chitinophagaceae bacterium]|nr:MAG: hypothetical protein EPO58_17545 [Chitinophagaceae bacterium]
MKNLFLFFVLGCAVLPAKAQTIKTIKGDWTVTKYYFCGTSAMGDTEAKQWLNRKLTIGDKITFEFSKIPKYKTFKNEVCSFGNSLTEQEVSTDEYFYEGFRCNPSSLKIIEKKVILIKMKCDFSPFSEFIMKSASQIIVNWDGVFFELIKV